MLVATATVTVNEMEARRLWEADAENRPSISGDDDPPPPTGQALADWLADFVSRTLESNWQFDAGVFADVQTGASTDSADLLAELTQCDAVINDADSTTPSLCAAKERRAELIDELGLADIPENSEHDLQTLLAAYLSPNQP